MGIRLLFILLCIGVALVIVVTILERRKSNKPKFLCCECKFYILDFHNDYSSCERIKGRYSPTRATNRSCKNFKAN